MSRFLFTVSNRVKGKDSHLCALLSFLYAYGSPSTRSMSEVRIGWANDLMHHPEYKPIIRLGDMRTSETPTIKVITMWRQYLARAVDLSVRNGVRTPAVWTN
jgi:hypothetical protein